MKMVFVDTSYYVAMLSARDALRPAAVSFTSNYRERYLTTEFVLTEVATFFTRPAARAGFVNLVHDLRADPRTEIVSASSDLFERAFQLFANRPDKEWSLTDCISFVVMQDCGLLDALTADRHFEQAGFRPLLV